MDANCSVLFSFKTLVLYSFILVMSHCKDTYDNTKAAADLQVPQFTETGANTFGCLVNGEPWANFGDQWQRALGGGNLIPNKVITATNVDSGVVVLSITGTLTVSKKGSTVREETMTLNIPEIGSIPAGVYQLTTVNGLFSYRKEGVIYSSLKRSPFTVSVVKDTTIYQMTFDANNSYTHFNIISGKFNGLLYDDTQTDSLRIVGGVFDVKY